MKLFRFSRPLPRRPLRYEGKTRIDPESKADLHRQFALPYEVIVTDFHVGLTARANRYFRRLAVGLVILMALIALLMFALSMTGHFQSHDLAKILIFGLAAGVAAALVLLAIGESARDSEECFTYLKEQDRMVSCFWAEEFQHAQVDRFVLRRRKWMHGEDARWIAELVLEPRSLTGSGNEYFVAASTTIRRLQPLATQLAQACDLPLRVETSAAR